MNGPLTDDADGIRRALVALGDSPDVVAERLYAAGCRGRRAIGEACPVSSLVAKYLYDTYGGDITEVVGHVGVGIDRVEVQFTDAPLAVVDLPPAVAEFVARFDQSDRYADLVVAP